MIRVLQVFARMDRGGAETMIMNLYRNIDRTRVQFDFVVHVEEECAFDEEILKLGGRIFRIPRFNGKNVIKYKNSWKKLLDAHKEWKIIHGHVRSTASIYLPIARKKGLFTISHSHNTSTEPGVSGLAKVILQYPIRYVADYYIACSSNAGEWLFGKKICSGNSFRVLSNAIDSEKFRYDETKRKTIREKWKLKDSIVIGNVSRFNPQKNHSFLIDIFEKIYERNKNAVLLLVGDGEDKEKIEKKVSNRGLKNSVFFMGIRSDVDCILQSIDVLVFPSLFEGLPVSIIEAQAAGVPCLLSDTISRECKITECVSFLSLNQSATRWAETAVKLAEQRHIDTVDIIRKHNYDIESNSIWLMEFYESKSDIKGGR